MMSSSRAQTILVPLSTQRTTNMPMISWLDETQKEKEQRGVKDRKWGREGDEGTREIEREAFLL